MRRRVLLLLAALLLSLSTACTGSGSDPVCEEVSPGATPSTPVPTEEC